MAGRNYVAMARMFRDTFSEKKVAIFPIDHGAAVEANELTPHLYDAKVNFVMYRRPGAKRPEEDCLDQGNLYLFEVREMVTPRKYIQDFLWDVGKVEIAILDDWAKSRSMPSIGGGWAHFVILGYPNARTAAFRDLAGGVDISPDRRSDRVYRGTRDYIRQNNPNIYFYLLGNRLLTPEPEDAVFERELKESGYLERAKLFAISQTDRFLVTPLANRLRRRVRKRDFVKDSTDRMLKTAALL